MPKSKKQTPSDLNHVVTISHVPRLVKDPVAVISKTATKPRCPHVWTHVESECSVGIKHYVAWAGLKSSRNTAHAVYVSGMGM